MNSWVKACTSILFLGLAFVPAVVTADHNGLTGLLPGDDLIVVIDSFAIFAADGNYTIAVTAYDAAGAPKNLGAYAATLTPMTGSDVVANGNAGGSQFEVKFDEEDVAAGLWRSLAIASGGNTTFANAAVNALEPIFTIDEDMAALANDLGSEGTPLLLVTQSGAPDPQPEQGEQTGNVTVYNDANHNGTRDDGETSASTGEVAESVPDPQIHEGEGTGNVTVFDDRNHNGTWEPNRGEPEIVSTAQFQDELEALSTPPSRPGVNLDDDGNVTIFSDDDGDGNQDEDEAVLFTTRVQGPRDEDRDGTLTDPCTRAGEDATEECFTPGTVDRNDCDNDGRNNMDELAARSDPCDLGVRVSGPIVTFTEADDEPVSVRAGGAKFVPDQKDRFLTLNGTSAPAGLAGTDRPVTAVLVNWNDRAKDTACQSIPTAPPQQPCQDPPASYNGNENTREDVPGGNYWHLANATGPADEPYATWSITIDLQGTDIPRQPGGTIVPVKAVAYSGPIEDGYLPETRALSDGSCVPNAATCTVRRDTRVPLVPVAGSPEWSPEAALEVELKKTQTPLVQFTGHSVAGNGGPTKKVQNVITANYEESEDAAVAAWALVCKRTSAGECDSAGSDPPAQWVACDPADGVWDRNVAIDCPWTPPSSHQPPAAGRFYVRVAVVNERGYNTTAVNGDWKNSDVVATLADQLGLNGNLIDRTIHDEIVNVTGRVVDQDVTGNTVKTLRIDVKDVVPGTAPLVEQIHVLAANITTCTPSGGPPTFCWYAHWNTSRYDGFYAEGNTLSLNLVGTDSQDFSLGNAITAATRNVVLDRNTPPRVEFATLTLDNGTVYEYNATTGNWSIDDLDVGPNPEIHGVFNVTFLVNDTDNWRPAWSLSRLDAVNVSFGKGAAPFVVTSPFIARDFTPFGDLGLEEIHVPQQRTCEAINGQTAAAGDWCTYTKNGSACLLTTTNPDLVDDIVKCQLDSNAQTKNTGEYTVSGVPGYILTSRGTIVLGADTVLLSAGFAECLEASAAQANEVAEGARSDPPTVCTPDENSVDSNDLDGNVDLQFGGDFTGILCETTVRREPPVNSAPACPVQGGNGILAQVIREWLVAVTINEEDTIVGVSTVCGPSTDNLSPWCSTGLRSRPSDEVEVRDYRHGDNDDDQDGDEYDQIDRSTSQTTTACEPSENVPREGWPPAVDNLGVLPDPLVPAESVCPFDGTPAENARPLSQNGAPDCSDLPPVPGVLDPCVIPFGQLAEDLGLNGQRLPVTVDGTRLDGYFLTPEDFGTLLGNAVCFYGTTLNREPSGEDCGAPGDQPGREVIGQEFSDNYSAGYLDHRGPTDAIGGDATDLLRGLRDPTAATSPRWAIPRGFVLGEAESITGLDQNLTAWNATVNASGANENDGLRDLFFLAFDGVEDFATAPTCLPAECTPSVTVLVNNAQDLDGDCFQDADERAAGSLYRDANSTPADLDEDCISDVTDPDRDGDGRTNAQEAAGYAIEHPQADAGELRTTDANLTDTDGDGYDDLSEFQNGTDPRDGDVTPDDWDGDGSTNDAEEVNDLLFAGNTRDGPGRAGDRDGDGYFDWEEEAAGSDPDSPSDTPDTPLPVDRELLQAAHDAAFLALGCPFFVALDRANQFVDGEDPDTANLTVEAERCATLLAGGAGAPSAEPPENTPGVQRNNNGTITVYQDRNGNGTFDDGDEAILTTPEPPVATPNPAANDNGDGTFTIYNDANANGTMEDDEDLASTPPVPALPSGNGLVVSLRGLKPNDNDDGSFTNRPEAGTFSYELSLWTAECEPVFFTAARLKVRNPTALTTGENPTEWSANAAASNVMTFNVAEGTFRGATGSTLNAVLVRVEFDVVTGPNVNPSVNPIATKMVAQRATAGACALGDLFDNQLAAPGAVSIGGAPILVQFA